MVLIWNELVFILYLIKLSLFFILYFISIFLYVYRFIKTNIFLRIFNILRIFDIYCVFIKTDRVSLNLKFQYNSQQFCRTNRHNKYTTRNRIYQNNSKTASIKQPILYPDLLTRLIDLTSFLTVYLAVVRADLLLGLID